MRYLMFPLILLSMIQTHANNSSLQQNDQNLFSELTISISENIEDVKSFDDSTKDTKSSIYGNIYIGENLLPKGKVYLLQNDSKGSFLNARTQIVNDRGYLYNKISDGKYSMYIIPEPDYDFNFYPKYLPTYFGSSYKWKKSENLEVNSEDIELDLQLLSYPESFYGQITIFGELTFNRNSKVFNNIPVVMFLLNENKEPMDFRLVDRDNGKYAFENLPEGNYYLYPESPGIFSEEFKTIISAGISQEKTVNFYAEGDNLRFQPIDDEDILSIMSENSLFIHLNQDVEGPVVCELISLSGSSVIKKIYNGNEIYMSTCALSAGIYILRVKTYDNSLIQTKKIYIDNY